MNLVVIPDDMDVRMTLDKSNHSAPRSHVFVTSIPGSFHDKFWVRIRTDISLEELANQLRIQETPLAKLNNVSEDHNFRRGDWVVLPSSKASSAKQLDSLDTSSLRRSAPLSESPPVYETAVVRFGDNLTKLSQRYRLTIQELLWLNPGLESSPLIEGSQIRIARATQASSPMVRGLSPVSAGAQNRTDTTILPSITKPLSSSELAMLEKIRSTPTTTWRRYGSCIYDWGSWKLIANGVRTTTADCGGSAMRWFIGVHCDSLKVNIYRTNTGWQNWEKPAGPDSRFRVGEDEMVSALCSNVAIPMVGPR